MRVSLGLGVHQGGLWWLRVLGGCLIRHRGVGGEVVRKVESLEVDGHRVGVLHGRREHFEKLSVLQRKSCEITS